MSMSKKPRGADDAKKTVTIFGVLTAIVSMLGTIIASLIQFGPNLNAVVTPTMISVLSPAVSRTAEAPIKTTLSIPSPTPTRHKITASATLARDIDVLIVEIENLRSQIEFLQEEIDSMNNGVSNTPDESKINEVLEDMKLLSDRLESMENVILEDPLKALEVTMLRYELESLKENYKSDMTSMRGDINRVYDLNKWFIGLMFTITIGLLSLGVSNFITKPADDDNKNTQVSSTDIHASDNAG
jgi:hypothetical protein